MVRLAKFVNTTKQLENLTGLACGQGGREVGSGVGQGGKDGAQAGAEAGAESLSTCAQFSCAS